MKQTSAFGEPDARATLLRRWRQTTAAMDAEAQRTNDPDLQMKAAILHVSMDSHAIEGATGCPDCDGNIIACPSWRSAQSMALTWLMRRTELA
jgi:hypothetical protein